MEAGMHLQLETTGKWARHCVAGLALIGAAMGAMPALADVAVAVKRTTVTYSDPDAYGRMTVTTTVSEVFPDGSNPSRHESVQQTVTATFAPVDLVNDWADQDQVICAREQLVQASALLGGLAGTNSTHYTAQRYDSLGREVVKSVDPTAADCVDPSLAEPLGYLTMSQSYYDFGGLKSQKLLAGQNVPAAHLNVPLSQVTYDATGTVPATQANALGHLNVVETELATGNVLTRTDPNLVQTQYQYDHFGRAIAEVGADGVTDGAVIEWCSEVGCPVEAENAVYRVTHSSIGVGGVQAAPTKRSYFDGLDREVLSEVQSAQNDGRLIIAGRKVYNAKGQVTASAAPYFAGETVLQWSYAEYDDLGRTVKSRTPNVDVAGGFAVSTLSYGALQVTEVNALNQTKVTLAGLAGKPVSITDNAGKTLTSVYDGEGNLLRTRDSKGNERLYTYDGYGHKVTDSDPDLGSWSYTYDALGNQLTQIDAKQQQTLMAYDILGRLVTRDEVGLSSVWEYDTAANGIGQQARTYTLMGDGITRDYERTLGYDSLGRIASDSTTRRIDPYSTGADPDFAYGWTFDAAGRVATVTYPGGFGVRNVYDQSGYLLRVQNLASSSAYWAALARDASGNVIEEELGNGLRTHRNLRADTGAIDTITTGPVVNGTLTASVQNDVYTFDPIGNLRTRSQYMGGNSLLEAFDYDNLNRLKSSVLTNGALSVSKSADYDELGNILNRSDVGDYTYTGCGGAHRVCSITGTLPSNFGYDANGNLAVGNGRTLNWTSFNMPQSITKGAVTSAFRYSSEHERVRQVETDSANSKTTTTVYLNPRLDTGGTFEKVYRPDGAVQRTYYVYAEGVVANVAYTTQDGSTSMATRYLHADHLGSIIATTGEDGAVIERMSFDAWGKRREFGGQDDAGNVLTAQSTVHGFTGHEMLDGLDLVHMNGRVYDPLVGRFASADPNVFRPDDLQSYNVYSYVSNNPLSFIDPSGFEDIPGLYDQFLFNTIPRGGYGYVPTGYSGNLYSGSFTGPGAIYSDNQSRLSFTSITIQTNYVTSAPDYLQTNLDRTLQPVVPSVQLNSYREPTPTVTISPVRVQTTTPTVTNVLRAVATVNERIISSEVKPLPAVGVGAGLQSRVESAAKSWVNTPYATAGTRYSGPNAQCQVGADCSGSTWKILGSLGWDYPYTPSASFPPKGYFAQVKGKDALSKLQPGDVIKFQGHLAIFAKYEKGVPMMFTARRAGRAYTLTPIKYWNSSPLSYWRHKDAEK